MLIDQKKVCLAYNFEFLIHLTPNLPMTTISTRIELINNFKPLSHYKKQPVDKRIRRITILSIINGVFFLLVLIYGYASIGLELVGVRDLLVWNKTGLIVVILTINSISFQNNIYQYLLLKHIRYLKHSSEQFIEWEINEDLQKIINQLNQPLFLKTVVVISGTTLFLAVLNYIASTNLAYGNYFKIPFILYSLYFCRLFWNKYKQLQQNLIHAEIN